MDGDSDEIRIGHKLPEEEVNNVHKRRAIVQQKLHCSENDVPTIALIGSGGGQRAMVGLLASVLQLKEEGLLDCMMYLSGVSGSTWGMASLYKEENWSTNVKTVIDGIFERLAGPPVTWQACSEKLKRYYEADPENYSLTEFWSAFAVPTWVKEIDETHLSDQRGKHHKDPYPIFTVIDKGMKQQEHQTKTVLKNMWVEITIPEVGYTLAGAFVDQKNFGSKFNEGKPTKTQQEMDEMDMLYIQGLCGSALADDEETKAFLWNFLFPKEPIEEDVIMRGVPLSEDENESRGYAMRGGAEESSQESEVLQTLVEINLRASEGRDYSDLIPNMNKLLEGKLDKTGLPVILMDTTLMGREAAEEELKRFTLLVCDCLSDWYSQTSFSFAGRSSFDVWTWGKIIAATTACIWQWTWGTTYAFLHKMPANEVLRDIDHAILKSPTRDYMDAGLLLNSPYFSVLRPERNVNLIISLDFSAGDPMLTVKDAHKFAKELGIPFPPVPEYPPDFFPDDFYVFRPENPEDETTPTVIHMPLFNKQNCGTKVFQRKAVDSFRNLPTSDINANYDEIRNEYTTFQGAYDGAKIEKLKNLAAANVMNTKTKLWDEIKKAKKNPMKNRPVLGSCTIQ